MTQKISESVSVSLTFDHVKKSIFPKKVLWNGRVYEVTKVGLHHTYREGTTLYHIFSVATETLFLRLKLNTDNLYWKLEEVSDGL